ncbi:MAG: MoxR family ATPase [Candidatus Eremiobacteraeota bacterium]|nr:MoxR family ATPase [Candidatus Eremiobacteraeota bacterium]
MTERQERPYDGLEQNLSKVIKGKHEAIEYLMLALFSGGHVLIEDVPGVGKTTMAKALAMSISGGFRRIQFTPDLLPTDILGSSIYNPGDGTFVFHEGPIFTNILLADEINRASPRTQSSLLEAMSERQVTVEGKSNTLSEPFLVIATQNPIEFHGTYPLPEAQLDRFALQISMGYPRTDDELAILYGQAEKHPIDDLVPVMDLTAVVGLQKEVRAVRVEKSIALYMLALVEATRKKSELQLGVSPRGSLMLYRVSQALAFMRNREYVLPDDVKEVAPLVLSHRIVLETKAKYSGVSKKGIIEEIIAKTKIPT